VKSAQEAAEPGYAARGPGERPVGVEAIGPAGPGSESGTTGGKLAKVGGSAETPLDPGGRSVHPGTDAPSWSTSFAWHSPRKAGRRSRAIRRAGRVGFARNVCVALGNWLAGQDEPRSEAVTLLVEALSDPAPLVRGHAAWALGLNSSAAARSERERRVSVEEDPWVGAEIISALEGSRPTRN